MIEFKVISQKPQDNLEERAELESSVSTVAKLALKLSELLALEEPDPDLADLVAGATEVQERAETCARTLIDRGTESENVRKSKLDILKI